MTAYAPQARLHHHIHPRSRLIATVVLVALAAGLAGYAIAGGFSSASNPAQDLSSRVMAAWASGDIAAINDLYAPNAKLVLEYPGRPANEMANGRANIATTIAAVKGIGNTYTQLGPVTSYTAPNGDLYVTSVVEVKGLAHQAGTPIIGYYQVHDGKIIRQIFLQAELY